MVEDISKVLRSVVCNYSRCFIIVAALDECQISDGGLNQFLSEIFDLQIQTGVNLFATSRFIPAIEKHFEGSISFEIRVSDEDVERYIDGHMSRLPLFVSRNPNLQNNIKTEIIMAVDGMYVSVLREGDSKANTLARFLLAQLHLDSLTGKRSPKVIRNALQQLPKGLKGLDSAYKEGMERIESQVTDSQELAKQVLSWITCARRPLTTTELQHALAVEIGASELDQDNLSEVEDIVSVCAGLVTIDEESDIIRLVHYTTQEYFQRTQNFWLPAAERDIARSCVTYLLSDAFETGFCQTDDEFEARLRLNVLYDYAARNWGHHARAASTEVECLTMNLLENEESVSAASQAIISSNRFAWDHGYSQEASRYMRGVHLAAYFGFTEGITAILNCTQDPDPKTEHGRTPLSYAAEQGHGSVVQLLLAANGVDLDSKTSERTLYFSLGTSPLSFAAQQGHAAVVRQLISTKGVNADSKDNNGLTPLLLAAQSGHDSVVQLLLATDGVNADSMDGFGCTPLSSAADEDHESVVQLLLATDGVDVNAEMEYKFGVPELERLFSPGQTPLCLAARGGHEAVVILFLAKEGIDVDKASIYGRTLLSFAAAEGHELVVCILLATNKVDINLRDIKYGRTALSWAAGDGYEAVVKLLLDNGADPDSKVNRYGWTPLSFAVANRYAAVVKLLLAEGNIDPNSKDSDGRTPLLWAACYGFEDIVKMLLSRTSINVDSKDRYGRTPLIGAAVRAQQAVVKLLLNTNGVDLGSKDIFGRSALSEASRRGNVDIMKLLIEKCKGNGMEIHGECGDILPQPETDPQDIAFCHVCLATFSDSGSYHHCGICSNGDFDICEDCITSGAFVGINLTSW